MREGILMSWTVVGKVRRIAGGDVFWETTKIFTDGFLEDEPVYLYTLEDNRGNRKDVIAHHDYELGEKIAEGDFQDVD
jgi:hypothetical protein